MSKFIKKKNKKKTGREKRWSAEAMGCERKGKKKKKLLRDKASETRNLPDSNDVSTTSFDLVDFLKREPFQKLKHSFSKNNEGSCLEKFENLNNDE